MEGCLNGQPFFFIKLFLLRIVLIIIMVELFHRTYGEKTPTIIIAHGLFGMADNWHNIAQKLMEHCRVITVDLRNHGHSPHHPDMHYSDMADDLISLMDRLGLEQPILAGHSMGGKLMMHFVSAHPQRVSKLIVADIAPKAYGSGHEIYFKALFKLVNSNPGSRAEAQQILAEDVKDPVIQQFLLKSLYRTPEGAYKLRMNVDAIYRHYDEIRGAIHIPWPISVPALFLKGEHSDYIQPKDEHLIAELFTDAEIKTIPRAGHWLHADNPADFTDSVLQFILT